MLFRSLLDSPHHHADVGLADEKSGLGMLTQNQYEAIGRLALAFNEIDQMLDMYLPDILGNPEPTVAFFVAESQNFAARKIDFFKNLLKAILRDRPTAQAEILTVLALLDKAKAFSGQRNDYIHAFAFVDWKARKQNLRMKNRVVECNEEEIMTLAFEMSELTVPLSHALYELKMLLIKLRYGA